MVAYLFGDTTEPASRWVDDERGATEDVRVVSELLAEQYMSAAEEVAERATGDLDSLIACDRGADGDDTCARRFIERILPQAFRRPATTAELDAYTALYETLETEQNFREAIRAVVEAVLQSPDFLYRVEFADSASAAVVRLDGYQLATRLSFLLWRNMPDEALFDAAARGELDDDAGVERIARMMLADDRAEPAIQAFFHHYLELEELETVTKQEEVFPHWNENIPHLMELETEAFIRAVMIEGDSSWETLLTAPWSMMNEELANYYAIGGVSGEEFQRVPLDPAHYSGMLTQGSIMATRARAYASHPIERGMFVRGKLLCGEVPDVPEGVEIEPPDPDPTLTTREQLAEHRENPVCYSCHIQMDPLGFAFEHFDGDGRYRDDENGLPIDTTGQIVDTDVDGDFDGVVELVSSVLESEGAQECFASAWFEYGHSRAFEDLDACSVKTIMDRFREGDFNVRELIVGLTLSDAFLNRVVDQDTVTDLSGMEDSE